MKYLMPLHIEQSNQSEIWIISSIAFQIKSNKWKEKWKESKPMTDRTGIKTIPGICRKAKQTKKTCVSSCTVVKFTEAFVDLFTNGSNLLIKQ